MNVAVTHRYHFAAAHVLCRDEWGPAENERVYGKCANPNGHGHNYGVEVTVSGSVDSRTGRVVDPEWLDDLVFSLLAKDPKGRPESAAVVAKTLQDMASTPLPSPRDRARKRRGERLNSIPPSEGLASSSHLGGDRQPVYKEPPPAVPATPVLVTVGLFVAAVGGMAILGFVLGAIAIALM